MKAVSTIGLMVLSCILGMVLVEAGFRAVIRITSPERFETDVKIPDFYGVYDQSLWSYNERYG